MGLFSRWTLKRKWALAAGLSRGGRMGIECDQFIDIIRFSIRVWACESAITRVRRAYGGWVRRIILEGFSDEERGGIGVCRGDFARMPLWE